MEPNTSGAPAPDVSAGSSPVTTAQTAEPTKSLQERMRDSLAKGRSDAAGSQPAEDAPRADDASTSSAAEPDADQTAALAGEGEDAKGDEPEKTIPLQAFQRRLAREREKYSKAQEQLNARDLELKTTSTAVQMLQAELARVKEALASGQAFDPRDEQLHDLRLQQHAQAIGAQLLAEHQAALEAQAQAAAKQAAQATLRSEMHEALDANQLVSFAELKSALLRAPDDADIAAVAKTLQAQKLALADKLRAQAQRPQAPRSAKPGAAGSTHRFSVDQSGMNAFLASRRNKPSG